MQRRRTIVVHGGAWAIPQGEKEPHLEGVRRAVLAGWEVLSRGGTALEGVTEAVRMMENDTAFNAGRGSVLNLEGEVELDAAIMNGETLAAGAVAAVQGVRHPIDLARVVMERSPHVLLVGSGALELARKEGIGLCAPSDLVVPRERNRWEDGVKRRERQAGELPHAFGPPVGDTVGAVARDGAGHVAAATSTGGSALKLPGRVGDSPLIGCGLYADDSLGAAASTGWGEGIIRVVLAYRAVSLIGSTGSASAAAREAVQVLEARAGGRGGIILVDPEGNPAFSFNTPHMAYAVMGDGMFAPELGI